MRRRVVHYTLSRMTRNSLRVLRRFSRILLVRYDSRKLQSDSPLHKEGR